jgi:KEOPS complex subunit Cgi121
MDTVKPTFEIRTATFCVKNCEKFLYTLRMIARGHETMIVCFDANLLVGRQHAEAAMYHAVRSFYGEAAIANSLEMEALLYASGTRQCSSATMFGVHNGENNSYVCCCPSRKNAWIALQQLMVFGDNDWETLDSEKRSRLKILFSISDEELSTVGDLRFSELVLERVALLDAYH